MHFFVMVLNVRRNLGGLLGTVGVGGGGGGMKAELHLLVHTTPGL